MSLTTIILIGIVLSTIFHFIGVKAGATKIVWGVIVMVWAASISIATSEVKEKGYKEIEKMRGKYPSTDKIIEESMPHISIYEMILIKNSFNDNRHNTK